MRAYLYLLLSATLWGLNFHFAAQMLVEADYIESGFWRYVFGVGTLFVISLNALPSWKAFKDNFTGVMLVGVIGLFCFNLFLFLGLIYTSPVNASLIVCFNPATTLILSFFILKTPIKQLQVLGIIISIIGVFYLLCRGDFAMLRQLQLSKGDILIFIANVLFALHHIWVKMYAKGLSNKHFTLLTNTICLASFLIAYLVTTPSFSVNYSSAYWLSAIGIGSFGTAVAYLSWNRGIAQVGATRASIFLNFVPLATAVAAIFLGQPLALYHIISGVIIISGLLITQLSA